MIKLKQILEQTDDMMTLYHITTPKNYESIKKDGGLDPTKTAKEEKVIELSKDKEDGKQIVSSYGWRFRPNPYYLLLTLELPKSLISWEDDIQANINKKIDVKYIKKVEKVPKYDMTGDILKKYKKGTIVVYIVKNSNIYGNDPDNQPYFIQIVDLNDDFPRMTPKLKPYEYPFKDSEWHRNNELNKEQLDKYENYLIKKGMKLAPDNKIETV